jgi:chromosome segregation ATPase
MTKRPDPPPSALVEAARELETAMARCEETLAEAAKLRLHSEKNVHRAARALQAAAEGHAALGGKVAALLDAIRGLQGRADEAARRMGERAAEIRDRQERLKSLQDRAADLGAAVRQLTDFAREAPGPAPVLERLIGVEERLGALLGDARAAEFEDVVRDLNALRQMLAALHAKLSRSS